MLLSCSAWSIVNHSGEAQSGHSSHGGGWSDIMNIVAPLQGVVR
jgi:hypothetical protein